MSSAPSDGPIVRPTIPMRYLAEIALRSGAPRASVAAALAGAGLPRSALRMPRLRVSIAQLGLFYAVLRREVDDELFGYFARPVPPGAYATLVRLLTGSADLSSALDALTRFYRVFDHHAYVRREVRGPLTTLTLVPRERAQAQSLFFTHGMLLTPWRTLAWLAGRELPLTEVALPRRFRQFVPETRYLFGSEPRFASNAASLVLRSELLRLPVVRRPEEADVYTKSSLVQLLLPAPHATLEGELRALFSSSTPLADATLAETARHLGLSRAALARKLKSQDLTFQRIKDEVRRDHAIGLLTGTSLSVATIAERVGYSASRAFQRAFREWTGVSPGALRRRS